MNRKKINFFKKIKIYAEDSLKFILNVRKEKIDLVINLYNKPSLMPQMYMAAIPLRASYKNFGFGSFANLRVEWPGEGFHAAEYHVNLIKFLKGDLYISPKDGVNYCLPLIEESKIETKLLGFIESVFPFVIIHPGTGSNDREYPEWRWKMVAAEIKAMGKTIVFTGEGKHENEVCERILMHVGGENIHNLVGNLSWEEYLWVISKASLVLCVESLASHIAAAYRVPCIALWTGINPVDLFNPINSEGITLTAENIPCIPCHKPCQDMECVRNIEPKKIIEKVKRMVQSCTPL